MIEIFEYLSWLSFPALVKYHASVTVKRLPLYCNFQWQQSKTWDLNRLRNDFGLNSTPDFGIKVWEKIPVFIRTSNNAKQFKKCCYRYIYFKHNYFLNKIFFIQCLYEFLRRFSFTVIPLFVLFVFLFFRVGFAEN